MHDSEFHFVGQRLRRGALVAVLHPQVRKALPRGSTSDLSLKTLFVLAAGLAVWIGYGLSKGDRVIIAANSLGEVLSASVPGFKIRDMQSRR